MATKKSTNRYMLIDGNALVHRGFHAIPTLTSKNGEHTNAVYGFSNMLMALIKEEQPTHIAVAFDVSRKTFRTEKFPEYKATRSATPEEFKSQIPLIHQVLKAMKINEYSLEGYEADDLLATISKDAVSQGFEVLICTGLTYNVYIPNLLNWSAGNFKLYKPPKISTGFPPVELLLK